MSEWVIAGITLLWFVAACAIIIWRNRGDFR